MNLRDSIHIVIRTSTFVSSFKIGKQKRSAKIESI